MDITHHVSQLQTDWKEILAPIADKHKDDIAKAFENNVTNPVFPPPDRVLQAFNKSSYRNLKAVIIGQDPYHTPGLANGYCFSVPNGKPCPPSLKNIFEEISHEFGYARTQTDLSDWAEQGVLLLNTSLTVEQASPGSHVHVWRDFVRDIIKTISDAFDNVCFIMWGNHAKSFSPLISDEKHKKLVHSHPSPLCRNPFVGCNHFKACNDFLEKVGKEKIRW